MERERAEVEVAHILMGSDYWGQVASFDARAPQQSSRLSLKGRGWGIDISLGHPPLLCLLFEGTNKYQAGRALVNRPVESQGLVEPGRRRSGGQNGEGSFLIWLGSLEGTSVLWGRLDPDWSVLLGLERK